MIVWHVEYNIDRSKWFEAVAFSKALFEEGGSWHNKTKGQRNNNGSVSGDTGRLVQELTFESLADYEAVMAEEISTATKEQIERFGELFGDNNAHRSFWQLAAEG